MGRKGSEGKHLQRVCALQSVHLCRRHSWRSFQLPEKRHELSSWYITLFKYKLADKDANVVLGSTTSVSWMLPQFWDNEDDYYAAGTGWNWYDPKIGATRYEMLYIDGMNTGRGFSVVYDQSFMWDNQISIGAPLVTGVLNWEVYASATAVTSEYDTLFDGGMGTLNWYYSWVPASS